MSDRQMQDCSELTALRQRIAALEAINAEYEQNQAALQAQAQRHWVIAHFTHSWEYWETTEGTLGYVSPSCERITGYTPEQFIANPTLLHDLIVPEDRPLWVAHQHEGETTGLSAVQFRIQRSDGAHRWIEHTCQPVWDEADTFLGFRVSNQDITERKQVENDICRSQFNFEILYKLTQMAHQSDQTIKGFALEAGIRMTDSRIGYLAFLDDTETQLTLYTGSKAATDEYPIAETKTVYAVTETGLWSEAIRQRKPIIINRAADSPQKNAPFGQTPVQRHLNIPLIEEDKIVALIGVGNKITDYDTLDIHQLNLILDGMWRLIQAKKAEEQRREREMRFRSIIENPLAAVYIIDDEDTVIYVNEEAAAIFGYTVDELVGKNTWQFIDVASRVDQQDMKTLRQQGESSLIRSEWIGLHKNGEKRIIESASLSIHNNQGKRQSIGILRDITQQRATEQQHLELALEKERGETLRMLIGNISHDIKTPLAAINTSLYLLEKHNDPEKRREKIANIHTHVQTLESFIQDLLALSRLDGTPELRLTPVDLNELIIEIEEQMRPALEQKGLSLILDMAENLKLIQADQSDIRRAFINLTENAIHYTPAGGTVTIRTRTQPQTVMVEIMDTGIGIDEDDIPHIFDRFYRTDQAQHIAHTGSGLGLAIVRRVVDMHQGQLEVSSTLGSGSTFRIFLPTP